MIVRVACFEDRLTLQLSSAAHRLVDPQNPCARWRCWATGCLGVKKIRSNWSSTSSCVRCFSGGVLRKPRLAQVMAIQFVVAGRLR